MTPQTKTPTTARARATKLALANDRVITRRQAFTEGLTRREIDGLVATGEWMVVHRGVYAIGGAPLGWETRVVAAVRAAEHCIVSGSKRTVAVSHMAAAVVHGLRNHNSALPEITVVGKAVPELRGVKVHRTSTLDQRDIQMVNGIPVTSGARMLCDLAGRLSDSAYVTLLDDTICARVASRERVCQRARDLRPGRPRLAYLIALTEPGAMGTFRSFLERKASGAITGAGLPEPRWNVPVHDAKGQIGVVDALWDWIPVIMEVEGLRFHNDPKTRQNDAERFNRLTEIARVRRFTYRDIMDRPEYVIQSLRAALEAGPAGAPLS